MLRACKSDVQSNDSICCLLFVEAPTENTFLVRHSRSQLPLCQNRVEPRFKIFFALGPQFTTFDGQRSLNRLHPAE